MSNHVSVAVWWRLVLGFCGLAVIFVVGVVSVQAATLPLASTVEVADATPGSVVIYDEARDRYTLSTTADSPNVFGVVAARPAIVLQTSSTSPLVTTQGVTPLLVDSSGGTIVRGDILTTADTAGIARKASTSDQYAFAIALEAFTEAESGLIQVEVNPTKAQAAATAAKEAVTSNNDEVASMWVRITMAVVAVLLGVGFILWSYRTMFVSGITSIGRNPRAKQAVLFTTVGGVILGIVLLASVVFIALGILVLPIA